VRTDEVCDRPLETFGSPLPELTLIAAWENAIIRKAHNIIHIKGGHMFTTYTYQDYLAAEDKIALLCKAIEKFKASAEFVRALSASSYFRGENPTIARKTILRARKIETRGTDGRPPVRAGREDGEKLDKKSPLVIAMKEWVDQQYEDGRQTVMTERELKEKIRQLAPDFAERG